MCRAIWVLNVSLSSSRYLGLGRSNVNVVNAPALAPAAHVVAAPRLALTLACTESWMWTVLRAPLAAVAVTVWVTEALAVEESPGWLTVVEDDVLSVTGTPFSENAPGTVVFGVGDGENVHATALPKLVVADTTGAPRTTASAGDGARTTDPPTVRESARPAGARMRRNMSAPSDDVVGDGRFRRRAMRRVTSTAGSSAP